MIPLIAVKGMLGFYSEVWDVHDYLIISIWVISKQINSETAKRRAILDQWWGLVAYESRPLVTTALEVWAPSSGVFCYCFHRDQRMRKDFSVFLSNLEYPDAVAFRWVMVRRNTASGEEDILTWHLFCFSLVRNTPCGWLSGPPVLTLWEEAPDVRTRQ